MARKKLIRIWKTNTRNKSPYAPLTSETPGNCYQNALEFVLQREASKSKMTERFPQYSEETTIVHGKIRDLEGKILDHAWVKITPNGKPPSVRTNGNTWPAETYYKTVVEVDAEYTPDEAFCLACNTAKPGRIQYGPWTAEERKKFINR